jgi:hypothetical protein
MIVNAMIAIVQSTPRASAPSPPGPCPRRQRQRRHLPELRHHHPPIAIPHGGRRRCRQRHPLALHLFEVMRHGAVPSRRHNGRSGMPSLLTSAGGGDNDDGGRSHIVVGLGSRRHSLPIDPVVQNSLGGRRDGQGKTWTIAGRDGDEDEDNDGGTHCVS